MQPTGRIRASRRSGGTFPERSRKRRVVWTRLACLQLMRMSLDGENPAITDCPMAENRTKLTNSSVEDYIASRASEQQRADCQELMILLKKLTQQPPTMWGPSIVGYGSYQYTYESGRTGEAPLAGFAIRGRELVVYLIADGARQKRLLSKLGKHKMGKVCLYFKRLSDLDKSILEQLVAGSIAEVKQRYG
jgi:hypothetical protein